MIHLYIILYISLYCLHLYYILNTCWVNCRIIMTCDLYNALLDVYVNLKEVFVYSTTHTFVSVFSFTFSYNHITYAITFAS